MSEKFAKINLADWRQFESVNIDFDEHLTVLTGANGSGKTTILNILGRHFGWNVNFVSTPIWVSGRSKILWTDFWSAVLGRVEPKPGSKAVGYIDYSGGQRCDLSAPTTSTGQYQIQLQNQISVDGLNVPSHRPAITYADVGSIPTRVPNWHEQYNEYQNLLLQTYTGGGQNPGIVIKRSLVTLAVFGYGNEAVAPNPELRQLFEGFQEKLRLILPANLGFKKLEVRMPDVILATDAGEFSLDATSGGVASLFGIAWQIYMFGWGKENFTVLIDEPENHLHPSMQREVLPKLATAFPKCQFIVATHSPLIVSSDPSASVYALVFSDQKRVMSKKLLEADLSGSVSKILRDILDVETTLPVWVEERIKRLLERVREEKTPPEALYEEIKKEGLEDSLGEFVEKG